jgi:photosystem II stability/assembly factor-like uncharacterized protein
MRLAIVAALGACLSITANAAAAPTAAFADIQQLRMTSATDGYAVAKNDDQTNRLLHTTDGGAHWQSVKGPSPSASGELVTFLADGTPEWFTPPVPIGDDLSDSQHASFADAQHGFVLIHDAKLSAQDPVSLFATSDAGAHWTKVGSTSNYAPNWLPYVDLVAGGSRPPDNAFGVMTFTSTKDGYICCGGSSIYATHDGGKTFTGHPLPNATDPTPYDLHFWSGSSATLIVEDMEPGAALGWSVYQTTDAGETWTGSFLPADPDVCDPPVSADDAHQVGVCVPAEQTAYLELTSRGKGETMASVPLVIAQGAQLDFLSPDVGWVWQCTDVCGLWRTTDGGKTFTSLAGTPGPGVIGFGQ